MAKRKQTSLVEKKSRFTNTEVIQFGAKYSVKGTYKQVYDVLRAVRFVEAAGFVVTKK